MVEEAFFPPVEGTATFEEEAFVLREVEEAVEGAFFPPDEGTAPFEDDDFILLISAIKALARFLTMTSRSGCFDFPPTSQRNKAEEKKKSQRVTEQQMSQYINIFSQT